MPSSPPLQLICLDLDGTCLAEGRVAAEVQTALADAIAAGTRWMMNSDRTAEQQCDIATALPADLQPVAVLVCQRHVHWRDDAGRYVADEEWNREADVHHAGIWETVTPHFPAWRQAIREGVPVVREVDDGIDFAFETEADRIGELHNLFMDLRRDFPELTVFSNRSMSALVPHRFSKGWLLRHAAATLGVGMDAVLAVGDYDNDLEMLDGSSAGRTGCPADASPMIASAVRAAGGHVAASPGPAGTAEIIRAGLEATQGASGPNSSSPS